jgi:preprotein translocase subunit YajC
MIRFIGLNLLLAQQTLLAADPAPTDAASQRMASNQAGDQIKFFMMMGVFALAMWFLLIAPQRKKAKELEATIKSLKPGDKIVTSSGILGVILTIKEKSLSIRSADTKLEILKSSVLQVIERSGEAGESKS